MKNRIKNATISELKNGFILKERAIDKEKVYFCLFCNTGYDEGDIYNFKKLLVNANKAMKLHIYHEHGNVFENLLGADKTQTGLTDTQKEFLLNYYRGMSDKEIAEKMNISESTVRYQRYSFREKAKQAKFILALSELLEDRENELKAEKSDVPLDENEKMLRILFNSVSPLSLRTFDFGKNKDKKRLFVLATIVKQFEKGRKYTEKEINAVLKEIYSDFATIRRSLIEYGFMERTNDCREYWVKENL